MQSSLLLHRRVRLLMTAVVTVQMLMAQMADQASTSSLITSSSDTMKLDLGELRKLGISAEDLLYHIRLLVEGRLGDCVDTRGVSPGDDNSVELHRQFVRNKTVTCNDGSKAGYTTCAIICRIRFSPDSPKP